MAAHVMAAQERFEGLGFRVWDHVMAQERFEGLGFRV
jgi:hypothetical protein